MSPKIRHTIIKATLAASLSWAVCAVAPAGDLVQVRVGEKGLQSLTYKGVEYCDPSGAGAVGFTGAGTSLTAAKPEDAARFVTTPTAVSVKDNTVTQTYPWGTLVVAYEAKGADLNVAATLNNTSGAGLNGWKLNVFQLNDRIVFRGGGGTFGFSDEMQWSHYYEQTAGARAPYDHYPQQHPHVYWWVDRAPPFETTPVKVMFADLTGCWDTGVARLKTDGGDRWPVSVAATSWEMAPAGSVLSDTRHVAIRFRDRAPDDVALMEKNRQRVKDIEKQIAAAQAKLKEAQVNQELGLLQASEVQAVEQALAARRAEWTNANWTAQSEGRGPMPSALEVCADGYEAWGRYNYRESVWTDRRPIGAFFGCPDGRGSPTNPNGWFKDPAVDTTTPAGREAFAKRLLAHMDVVIDVLKRADAQGLIWWDVEGARQPHPITYIGDPRVLDPAHPAHKSFAPELDTPVEYKGQRMMVVDACFQKLKDAGLKTGLTIRPQQLTFAEPIPVEDARKRVQAAEAQVTAAQAKLKAAREEPEVIALGDERGIEAAEKELAARQADLAGARAQLKLAEMGPQPSGQAYPAQGDAEILPKARYAHDRWGCTLFYVDSISGVFGYWWIDKAARELQDCLFMPEWATPRTYRCSAQFSYTPMTGYTRGVPEELRAAWPDAFCAMANLQYGNANTLADLLIAVKRGNLPVFDCFYPNVGAADAIREVYRKAGTRHAPRAADQKAAVAPDQPLRLTLAATDEDGEAVTFVILAQPAHGTLSGFDAKAGTVIYTPAKGYTGRDGFTYKAVDASGLNSNRGHVTVEVK
jgi:hypothetical protein